MPYVEGFGTWPFGEEWLWEAMATCYLPLLDVLDAAPGRVTLSLTPVLCDQLEAPGVGERFLAFLRDVRPESHRLDVRGGRRSRRGSRARALRRRSTRGRPSASRHAAATSWPPSRRTRPGPPRPPTPCCRCSPPRRASGCRSRPGSPRTARASAAGAAGSGCPSAHTRRGSTSRSRRRACTRSASTSPTSWARARRSSCGRCAPRPGRCWCRSTARRSSWSGIRTAIPRIPPTATRIA